MAGAPRPFGRARCSRPAAASGGVTELDLDLEQAALDCMQLLRVIGCHFFQFLIHRGPLKGPPFGQPFGQHFGQPFSTSIGPGPLDLSFEICTLLAQHSIRASRPQADTARSHLLQDSAARRAGWRLGSRCPEMRKLWWNHQIGKMQSLQARIPSRWGCGGLKTPRAGS